METKERKHGMPRKKIDRDILVSVDDAGDVAKKEYDSYIKQQEEIVDDLDNQEYSEGENYED
jgi:hypothetical protein